MTQEGVSLTVPDLETLLTARNLHGVFQPIVDVGKCRVFGHEGLIRGPEGSPWHSPTALFREAAAAGVGEPLEFIAVEVIMDAYRPHCAGQFLFVNCSTRSIRYLGSDEGRDQFTATLDRCNLAARSLVVEITEHERVSDHAGLATGIEFLRGAGVGVALDDFGDGSSSLRLWAELQPNFVKIDRYFCHGIHSDGKKMQTVKAMQRLAETFGSQIIAAGVEDTPDLRILRDLGIGFVQGYATGRPALVPAADIPAAALAVLAARDIAVFPELRRAFHYSPKADQLLIPAPPLAPHNTNHELLVLFRENPQLHAVAVVDEDRPVGLVNRRRFTEKYLLPYYPEVYGRKSCTEFMDRDPVLIETSQPLEGLVHVLTAEDQRYLSDGYILVDAGRYRGLGTAEQLVRSVTELRIESARHANPLTFLPGNIPITEHIRRLLAGDNGFAASYCDLNDFKPFNDRFGYWHGDKMIRLLASVIVGECDPQRDFAGHVGGDDFVVLFQSTDWQARCSQMIARFNQAALSLFDTETRERGYLESEDRRGTAMQFPLTTLSIGALYVAPGTLRAPEDVAAVAAAAKHHAKKLPGGLYVHIPPPNRDSAAMVA